MKNTIWVNMYESNISNDNLSELFTDISIDPQIGFAGCADISLYHLTSAKTGYGHWRISVDLEINDRKLTISTTTIDSIAIDDWSAEEGEEDEDGDDRNSIGLHALLSECIRNNEDEIINTLLNTEEAE